MRRSSSNTTGKENPRLMSSFVMNNSQTQDINSFCYDKLESVHFESQEIQQTIEGLLSKMKNDASLQNNYRADQGFIKMKKDDFVYYYTQLKDVYKGIRKLSNTWDGLFEDFSSKHSQTLAKKSKEVESLNNHYKYKLKSLEFEKKSALEAQKSDLLKREQEVLDAVNNFLNLLKSTKKTWNNNLTELQFCVQEQAQTINYLSHHKASKLQNFSQEIDSLFTENSPTKGNGPITNRNGPISSERSRAPFTELINNLSPINDLPKIGLQHLHKSPKDDSQIQSSKREKFPDGEISSIDELFALHRQHGGEPLQDNSCQQREQSGWDPNLDDEESMETPNVDQIEKALELLFQNGLLDPQAVKSFDQIMKSSASGIDKEIQMNLFKDFIKLQLKRQNKDLKNQDLPLIRTNNPLSIIEEVSRSESAMKRKSYLGTSTANNLNMKNPGCLTSTQDPIPQSEFDSKGLHQINLQVQKVLKMDAAKGGINKNDISLSDLLKVKEYSFVLESPLSTKMMNMTRDVEFHFGFPKLQHVNKDDLLQAESLPVTMKEGEFSKIMPDQMRDISIDLDANQSAFMNFTKRKDPAIGEEKRRNFGDIKVIEEFKNSSNFPDELFANQQEESYESSDRSTSKISSQKRKMLYEDETQLEWETNRDSKDGLSRRTKNLQSGTIENPISATAILNEKLPGTGTIQEEVSLNLIPNTKDLRSKTSTINRSKLFPMATDASRKIMNTKELAKGNATGALVKRNHLRTSHLTGSTRTKISTKANTRFNEGEDLIEHTPLTMFASLNHTEPLLNDKHNFSHLVETDAGTEEKISHIDMNNSFPPYWKMGERNKKEVVANFATKRNGNYTSFKSLDTEKTGWESKNIIPKSNSGNLHSFSSFRASRGFGNQRSRSDTSVWNKPMNVIPETENLFAQKKPRNVS